MLTSVLTALDDQDAQPLRQALARIGVDTRALADLPLWNAGTGGGTPPAAGQRVEPVLARAFTFAAGVEGGLPMVLLYVLYEVEQAWEASYRYAPMWETLEGAQSQVAERPALVRDGEAPAVRAVLALLGSLDHQIRVENAMTCGRLDALAAESAGASRRAAEAAAVAGELTGRWARLGEFVAGEASGTISYYRAMVTAAGGLREFLATGASLEPAVTALAAAEAAGDLDHYDLSELRAHRFSLDALEHARDRPWLRIDHGKLVYVYPFALPVLPPAQAVARVRRDAARWRLNDVAPAAVRRNLQLDDVWDGADYLGRRFDGTGVELPQVLIRDGDGVELAKLDAEIRFSTLGNHYIRFETELIDAGPHEVYTALFRATPEHGFAKVCFGGDQPGTTHPRLSDLAVRLARDVGRELGGAASGGRVIARPGMFHVLVSVHAASLSSGTLCTGADPRAPRREVRTVEDLAGAVGAEVLTNPVTHCVGSLAEWIQYRSGLDGSGHGVSLAAERLLRTCNTTVLVAPGLPEFSTATRETMAEFVASLDGLFAGWFSELARHHRWIGEKMPDVDVLAADAGRPVAHLDELAAELERRQIRLHDFATETRSVAALIESPTIVSSPVVASTLAALRAAAGYPAQVAELNDKIEEVLDERLGLRIEALARRRAAEEAKAAEREARRRRARLDTLLAVIAAIGVSGLAQIVQAGYDLRVGGAVWLVGAIAMLAAVVGLVVWRSAAHHHDRAPAGDPAAAPAGRARRRWPLRRSPRVASHPPAVPARGTR